MHSSVRSSRRQILTGSAAAGVTVMLSPTAWAGNAGGVNREDLGTYTSTTRSANPANLQSVYNNAPNGTLILLDNGTYGDFSMNKTSGTSGARNIIAARYKHGAVLTGRAELAGAYNGLWGLKVAGNGSIVLTGGDHTFLWRLLLDGCNNEAIVMNDGDDHEVLYCTFSNWRQNCINVLRRVRRPLIQRNYFNEMDPAAGNCIYIGEGAASAISDKIAARVRYNVLKNIKVFDPSRQYDPQLIEIKSSNCVVEFNTLYNQAGFGKGTNLLMRHGQDNIVRSNYLENVNALFVRGLDNSLIANRFRTGARLRISAGNCSAIFTGPAGSLPGGTIRNISDGAKVYQNDGPLDVGFTQSNFETLPAQRTQIYQHTGNITFDLHANTVDRRASPAPETAPMGTKLADSAVGADAA